MRSPLLDGLLGAIRKPPQRRLDVRHAVALPVAIITDATPLRGLTGDIGFGGLSVQLGKAVASGWPPAGAHISLSLELPVGAGALSLTGRVAWAREGRFGVALQHVTARQLWTLHQLSA